MSIGWIAPPPNRDATHQVKFRGQAPRFEWPAAGLPRRPAQVTLAQLAAGRAASTVVNVLFAFWPRLVMAAMHTTMIRASMTAYSTAVGPSSRFRKLTMFFNMRIAPDWD